MIGENESWVSRRGDVGDVSAVSDRGPAGKPGVVSDVRVVGDERPRVSDAPVAPHVAPTSVTGAPAVVARPATASLHKTRIIGHYGGYRRTISFAYTCLVYHATTLFCERLYSYKNDPLGKTSGQMIGAARSARQNIVEGSSRAGTSKETELRLYDVAKARLETRDAKIAGDGAPICPKCNGPMRKMVARKGRNAGQPFWGCRNYPNCKGTRPWGRSRWAE